MKPYYREAKITLPIYGGEIFLVDTNDNQSLEDNHGIEIDNVPFASCFERNAKQEDGSVKLYHLIVINMKNELKKIDVGILAHECFHLTNFIFEEKGIIPDVANDEPQAYLLGYLVDIAHKFYFK